jgi:hypothetical protein
MAYPNQVLPDFRMHMTASFGAQPQALHASLKKTKK